MGVQVTEVVNYPTKAAIYNILNFMLSAIASIVTAILNVMQIFLFLTRGVN